MARLLVVHHSPSPTMHTHLESVRSGANNADIEGVEVTTKAALAATASDVLQSDGYILGSPANLGYMSGALKHFFDTIYYPTLEETVGRPFGFYLHGNNDTDGARLAIEKIVTGLRWRLVAEPVQMLGDPSDADDKKCWELGATMSATLAQ